MPFVETSTGARLHYEEQGALDAPLVVALHGMLGTPQRDLAQVIEWLSTHYHVFAPSLRGYGQSEPKPRDFPLNFYQRDAADVLAFMDALGIERAHLLGYSDGGETALIAAGTQPARFQSVTVWGAVGTFPAAMRPVIQKMYPATWIKPEDMALHSLTDADAFALGWINAVKYMIDAGGDVSLSLADKIACPVLLMLGDEDRLNPADCGRELIARTKRGRLVMFACGHAIHKERWDEFAAVVGAFLKGS